VNNKIKLVLSGLGALLVLGLLAVLLIRYTTKAHSPQATVIYERNGLELEVTYSRPLKRDRAIFGELVPYNEVWRTGANEATTFQSKTPLLVDGSTLPAGKYTLWTIPMETSWKIIFNSQMYPWGIDLDRKSYRNPQFDVLVLERPVELLEEELEQFSISFLESGDFVVLLLAWDQVQISIPVKKEETPTGRLN